MFSIGGVSETSGLAASFPVEPSQRPQCAAYASCDRGSAGMDSRRTKPHGSALWRPAKV